jgi:hypothetical protein
MKQMWCAAMFAAAVATAGAQGGAGAPEQKPMDKPAGAKETTLTGCLQADANKTMFWLSDAGTAGAPKSETGAAASAGKASDMKKTYRLSPASSVSLQPHVGHKVEITGTIDPASARGTAGAETPAPGATGTAGSEAKRLENAPQVNVTAVKHVSPTCQPGQ